MSSLNSTSESDEEFSSESDSTSDSDTDGEESTDIENNANVSSKTKQDQNNKDDIDHIVAFIEGDISKQVVSKPTLTKAQLKRIRQKERQKGTTTTATTTETIVTLQKQATQDHSKKTTRALKSTINNALKKKITQEKEEQQRRAIIQEEMIRKAEEERLLAIVEEKKIEEAKAIRKEAKRRKRAQARKDGTLLTPKQKEDLIKRQQFVEQLKKQGMCMSSTFKTRDKKEGEREEGEAVQLSNIHHEKDLRSPIVVILGHVDTGKTSLLDKIRNTRVQKGEAGYITQQISITYMPYQNLTTQFGALNTMMITNQCEKLQIPGLLLIDTPGHESFHNLRSRGSNLCDIAVLVVDLLHNLQPQTIESIKLLRMRNCPFVVALNKVDKCYDWKPTCNTAFRTSFEHQCEHTKDEFERRTREVINAFATQGLNACLYWENDDFGKNVSLIPTSASTGEGIPDLIMLLMQLSHQRLNMVLQYKPNHLQCTVLDVNSVEGHGTTIDVVLANGTLQEGDTIVLAGLNGPIVTNIRSLLVSPLPSSMQQNNQNNHVNAEYTNHKVVKAAMGVKIAAHGLSDVIAGSQILVAQQTDELETLKKEVMVDITSLLSKVDKSGKGVYVQTSSLGSLEALLQFLSDMNIPVHGMNIGPVSKKDVMKAAIMLEHTPEFAIILAFNVAISTDAIQMADQLKIRIFTSDVIYQLKNQCMTYMDDIRQQRRIEGAAKAVFPAVLDIIPRAIFNAKNPIVIGCRVIDGYLRLGTPLCVPSKDNLLIGRVIGIQKNHVDQTEAKKGDEISVKIETSPGEQNIIIGRHFDETCQLVSKVTRESIDLLKAHFKDDIDESGWRLVVKLKKIFNIL